MTCVYELRTFVAKDDRLGDLVEQWESGFHSVFARFHDVLGSFVAHPEKSEMPTGVAVLIRHVDNTGPARSAEAMVASGELAAVDGPVLGDLVQRTTSQFLDPLAFSQLT